MRSVDGGAIGNATLCMSKKCVSADAVKDLILVPLPIIRHGLLAVKGVVNCEGVWGFALFVFVVKTLR